MKHTLRIAFVFLFACAAVVASSSVAQAQRVDFGFAVSGLNSPSASNGDCPTGGPTCDHQDVSMTGGTYLGFNGDVIFWHNLGVGAEINWRASQGDYAGSGLGYRPIFYNFNAVYSPKVAPHVYIDLVAGIGAANTHYYTGPNCSSGYYCTNYTGITHFDGDFGGGLKLVARHVFIRPEARVYLINNNAEFSSNHAIRYGATLGYTFK